VVSGVLVTRDEPGSARIVGSLDSRVLARRRECVEDMVVAVLWCCVVKVALQLCRL